MRRFNYGKYKGIIASIALFLIFDASVLFMNFYISFSISEDAQGVNIAGRQRMLSQRTMKSLFDIEASQQNPADMQVAINELQATTQLFNKTLDAFNRGGSISGANADIIQLEAVSSDKAVRSVKEAQVLWEPYYKEIQALLRSASQPDSDAFQTSLGAAILQGKEKNLSLLKLMNDLTVELEDVASSRATTLRIIQTVGITLAIINFFIILFHFVRQLRESDEKIASAQQQTDDILDTVNEGLFLIDNNRMIGDQYSTELANILNHNNIANNTLNDILKGIVSDADMTTANNYIGLMFDKRKKEKLLGSLNPLRQVEVQIANGKGQYISKYLSFAFTRVLQADVIVHVLVTVTDITQKVLLAKELEASQKQNESQMELLSSVINCHPDLLPKFLKNSENTLQEVNNILRLPSKSQSQYISKANRIFALIHNFKGEASALNLDWFADQAHQFEDQIAGLKTNPHLDGNDFLGLTISLNQMMSQIESVMQLTDKLSAVKTQTNEPSINPAEEKTDWSYLHDLAEQCASRQQKKVELTTSGLNDLNLNEHYKTHISHLAVQLIRNGITHGIEEEQDREQAQKSVTGKLDIRLTERRNGDIEFVFSDDGLGIDVNAIRASAIECGLISEEKSELMDKKQILSLIFSPDFTTQKDVTEDAGRGVGMHAVRQAVNALSGKISISSRRGIGTTFSVLLPPMAANV